MAAPGWARYHHPDSNPDQPYNQCSVVEPTPTRSACGNLSHPHARIMNTRPATTLNRQPNNPHERSRLGGARCPLSVLAASPPRATSLRLLFRTRGHIFKFRCNGGELLKCSGKILDDLERDYLWRWQIVEVF